MHAATKVNRYPTEGRQALAIRLAGTEGGIEWARVALLLAALADGDGSGGKSPTDCGATWPVASPAARDSGLREARAAAGRDGRLRPA